MSKMAKQLRHIDDASLDPYQFRLLMHIWRVGECWESLRTTSKKCGMSLGKTSQVRQWLVDNSWVKWQPAKNGKMALTVCSPDEQFGCERSPHERECSPYEHEQISPPPIKRSPHERKLSIQSEVEELTTHFQKVSGILPTRWAFDDDWIEPLTGILNRVESVDKAKDVITRSIEFARNGDGGKRYTIASPRSIANIAVNLEEETPIAIGSR